ncbi:helix-turn-helix domain-containing protein [uncultured Draconibacterium sp.]|uniref:helix-turn-helix domain-containing protein n=1 Tax=uncultured Draconibacterium sp. TaxID=1573823 RepID=UPI0025E58DC6|nr:helix-turn-helix domain-containing protein [uncultured Draconibacterium sp.]
MSTNNFTPITPELVFNGLIDNPGKEIKKRTELVRENNASENNYMDMFANLVRIYGKRDAKDYAKMLNANYRHFDGAIRCMSGMSAHQWINNYLCLVACDLVEHTDYTFKTIGKILGFSQSSFSQFFRSQKKMQPWEYRNLKRHGRKRGFFYD